MQLESGRRSNRERTEVTRSALLNAARNLFIEKGYAEAATPDIVAAAGVTRGALYHHFADKQALFHAVVEQEAAVVAAEIERAAAPGVGSAVEALLAGGDAYLEAMREAGRTRLLLLDGPAVLGREEMDAIDNRHGNRTLREGLMAAIQSREIRRIPLDPLTALVAAAFDRAALAIEGGADRDAFRVAMHALINGLLDGRRHAEQDD